MPGQMRVAKAGGWRIRVGRPRVAPWMLVPVWVALVVSAPPVARAQGSLSIEIVPPTLSMRDEPSSTLVLLSNDGDDLIQAIEITTIPTAGVEVEFSASDVTELPPGAAMTVKLDLRRGAGALPGQVLVRVGYEVVADDAVIPGVAVAVLEIDQRAAEVAEEVATLTIATTLATLDEQRPGEVFLNVQNVSDRSITVTGVAPAGPVIFDPPSIAEHLEIAPGQSHEFSFEVHAPERVQPRSVLLRFDVALTWQAPGGSRTGNLYGTHTVELGVFGETQILTALGVPTFLLLPGFLAIVTIGLLWGIGLRIPAGSSAAFPLEIRSANFWYFGVLSSFALGVLYFLVSGNNLLIGYGFGDIVAVWFLSIVAGALFWFLLVGLVVAVRWGVAEVRGGLILLSSEDDPLTALRKLGRQGVGVYVREVQVAIGGGSQAAYLLQPEGGSGDPWIGPQVAYGFLKNDADTTRRLNEELRRGGALRRIADVLDAGQKAGVLRVEWSRAGQLTGPRRVAEDSVTPGVEQPLVVEKV